MISYLLHRNPFQKGVDWPKGEMRTLKSIRDNFEAWRDKAKSNPDLAKKYKNCINYPMFKKEDNNGTVRTIDLLPPCELHLLLGPVNHMLEEMEKVWNETDFWVSGCNAYKRGQDHGKLNGNGCSLLLQDNSLEHLNALLPENLSKFSVAFQTFAKVVKGCFTYKVSSTIKHDIEKFKEAYLKLNISVTPKVHIVFQHLYQFLADSNSNTSKISDWNGLGMYSEQAFEAVHASFKKRWENFKVNPENEQYAKKLLRAVCCFNGLNTFSCMEDALCDEPEPLAGTSAGTTMPSASSTRTATAASTHQSSGCHPPEIPHAGHHTGNLPPPDADQDVFCGELVPLAAGQPYVAAAAADRAGAGARAPAVRRDRTNHTERPHAGTDPAREPRGSLPPDTAQQHRKVDELLMDWD